jgi:hypothetical protein
MSPPSLARLTLLLLFFLPGVAMAQAPAANPSGVPKREQMRVDGTLQGMQGNLLQLVTEGGDQWVVKVEAQPENITYQASAQPDWLQPGMYVQFHATFDQRGRATAPVSQLTVFTPNADTPLGAFPESGLNTGTNELFADTKPTQETKPKKPPEVVPLNVAGRLTGLERGKIRVAASNVTLEADLADDATIAVELNNYSLARMGDKISVNGWYVQKGHGLATVVLVRAAQPLGAVKKPRVAASPEDRKRAFDALEDLSAGESAKPGAAQDKPDADKPEEPKKETE